VSAWKTTCISIAASLRPMGNWWNAQSASLRISVKQWRHLPRCVISSACRMAQGRCAVLLEGLAGRGVLVTGAGSSVGRVIAERFLAEGAQVHIADVNPE